MKSVEAGIKSKMKHNIINKLKLKKNEYIERTGF